MTGRRDLAWRIRRLANEIPVGLTRYESPADDYVAASMISAKSWPRHVIAGAFTRWPPTDWLVVVKSGEGYGSVRCRMSSSMPLDVIIVLHYNHQPGGTIIILLCPFALTKCILFDVNGRTIWMSLPLPSQVPEKLVLSCLTNLRQ